MYRHFVGLVGKCSAAREGGDARRSAPGFDADNWACGRELGGVRRRCGGQFVNRAKRFKEKNLRNRPNFVRISDVVQRGSKFIRTF